METKTHSIKGLSSTPICPEQLTSDLIMALKRLLESNVYLSYKTTYCDPDYRHEINIEGQLATHFTKAMDRNVIDNIRQASNIWNSLELIYRLTVLDAFSALFYEALVNHSPVEKTILFCHIFVNDFVQVITSQ